MGKVYSLFSADGTTMKEIKPLNIGLPIGTKLTSFQFAMNETSGVVIEEPNEFGQQKCCYIQGCSSGFFTIDKYTRPISEKFGIGTYYNDDLFDLYSKDEIDEFISCANLAQNMRIQEEETETQANEEEIKNLPLEYPFLIVNSNGDNTITKKNLVADLKKHFKGIKFSVRKEHYNTYSISWINGPSNEDVEEITDKYIAYENDYSGDFRDYKPSNFNRLFGGFKYLSLYREQSEEIKALKEALKIALGDWCNGEDSYYPESVLRAIFYKSSFPLDAKEFKIQKTSVTAGNVQDFFKIDFNSKTNLNE